MNSKIVGIVFLGVLLGGIIGYGGAYGFYIPQINELSLQYENLSEEYNNLNIAYENLSEEYEDLNINYETLEDQRDDVQDQYSTLSSQFNALQIDYASTKTKYKGLSNDVQDFEDLLQSYCYFEESFSRVLSSNEVNKVSSIVFSITRSSDIWYSYEKIYDYIVDNVEYVNDILLPYIYTYQHTSIDGDDVITSFTTNTRGEYIQTPQLTLDIEQGDCDDQAILAYAMIGYYDKYIHGTEYNLYIASIDFSEGEGHATVFLPVENGKLCIVDPAGNYLTKSYSSIIAKDASPSSKNMITIGQMER